jgi:hypothetical protein
MKTTRKPKDADARTAVTPTALRRMDEIQQTMRMMCEPNYDEFHRMEVARGFVTITIPKKTRR